MNHDPSIVRTHPDYVRDRPDRLLKESDLRSIKQGFIDWIMRENLDHTTIVPNKATLVMMLPDVMLENNDFLSLDEDCICTSKKFFKNWLATIRHMLENLPLLEAKLSEAATEREQLKA